MENITISKLDPNDTETITLLIDRLAPLWKVSGKDIENEFIKPSFLESFPYIYIAKTADGNFAGDIILSIEKQWFLGLDNQVWINAVFVPEKYRNQGIARKLISTTEEVARGYGYKYLYLDTVDAIGYYQKIGGWDIIGTDVWKGEEVTIMSKKL